MKRKKIKDSFLCKMFKSYKVVTMEVCRGKLIGSVFEQVNLRAHLLFLRVSTRLVMYTICHGKVLSKDTVIFTCKKFRCQEISLSLLCPLFRASFISTAVNETNLQQLASIMEEQILHRSN